MENEGRAWDKFMRRMSRKSERTQKAYLKNINYFFNHYETDAQAFYELRREGWKSEDPLDGDEVEEMVSDYIKHLDAQGKSPGTVSNYLKPIALFLKTVKMPLDTEDIDMPRKIYNGQRRVAADQIIVMLQKVGTEFYERNQAMILMAKDTGLRMSDIAGMDLEHYTSSQLEETEQGPFRVFQTYETEKTGDYAHIRMGPESVKAVDVWLSVRGMEPGPLFTKRGGGGLCPRGASAMFLRKSGHLKDNHKISGHSFRKYHFTGCEDGGMSENWIRRLQGKAHNVYSAPSEEKLTQAYIKAYPMLRIYDTPESVLVRETTLEVLKLREELAEEKAARAQELAKIEGEQNISKVVQAGLQLQVEGLIAFAQGDDKKAKEIFTFLAEKKGTTEVVKKPFDELEEDETGRV